GGLEQFGVRQPPAASEVTNPLFVSLLREICRPNRIGRSPKDTQGGDFCRPWEMFVERDPDQARTRRRIARRPDPRRSSEAGSGTAECWTFGDNTHHSSNPAPDA